mmetsp:Transcript_43860/g.138850  ORF Transcript_43860/g.138850 Transcript_43860/m.138850 type:complete len:501 (+) Transcript_43860:1232-2734(+)
MTASCSMAGSRPASYWPGTSTSGCCERSMRHAPPSTLATRGAAASSVARPARTASSRARSSERVGGGEAMHSRSRAAPQPTASARVSGLSALASLPDESPKAVPILLRASVTAAGGASGGAAGSGKLMLTGPGAGSSAGGAVVAPSSSGGSSAVPPGSTRLVPRRREARHDLPKPEWHAPWKLMRVISGHLGWVRCVAVDPTNQWYATGSADRTIKVWDLASGTLKLTLTGHISTIRGLAVSDRSPYLFSAGEDKMVRCWDLEYNRVIRDYHGHLSGVYSLSLHPTLDLLCTGGRDSVVRVWDIRTKANVHTLTGHNQTVVGLATQALEPQVISGSMDSTIRLWDLVAGRASAVLTNHKKAVRSLLVHPTEYTFCSASADNLKKWKCPEGKFLHNITGHNSIINALAINQDNVMVAGGDNGKLHLYDWKTGYNFQTPETVAQPGSLESERGIYCAAFDQSGSRLITGEADKTVKIWKEDPEATAETHPVNYEPPRERKRY